MEKSRMTCEHCGAPFAPRTKLGGLPRKFCPEPARCRGLAGEARRRLARLGGRVCATCAAPIDVSVRSNVKYCGLVCKRVAERASTYGLSVTELADMTARQTSCGLCGRADADLVVDHCHATGMVRDLLCHQCNLGIGLFADDPDRLLAAAMYLERWGRVGVEG